MKYAFRLRNLLDAEAHGKAMRFLVVIGWNVRTHQVLTADREAGVHDLAAPFYWYMFRGGRALVREHGFVVWEHGFDFGVKRLLIEFECLLAVAIEMEIRA